MKFTELEPRWLTKAGARVGVAYRTPGQAHGWLATMFAPTPIGEQWDLCRAAGIDPDHVHVSSQSQGWSVDGDTFDALTLSPSINLPGVWHGFIINGEVISV